MRKPQDASPVLESIKLWAYLFLELECNTVSITTFFCAVQCTMKETPIFSMAEWGCTKKWTTCITYIHTRTHTNVCALPFNNERNIPVFLLCTMCYHIHKQTQYTHIHIHTIHTYSICMHVHIYTHVHVCNI
jgi:hypothetical protein